MKTMKIHLYFGMKLIVVCTFIFKLAQMKVSKYCDVTLLAPRFNVGGNV